MGGYYNPYAGSFSAAHMAAAAAAAAAQQSGQVSLKYFLCCPNIFVAWIFSNNESHKYIRLKNIFQFEYIVIQFYPHIVMILVKWVHFRKYRVGQVTFDYKQFILKMGIEGLHKSKGENLFLFYELKFIQK